MHRTEAQRRIADLASQQWGLFTSAQAHQQGIKAKDLQRLANARLVERIDYGIYRTVGAPRDQHEHLKAIWLSLDPSQLAANRLRNYADDYVVSHGSATQLHVVGDLVDDEAIFTTGSRKQSTRPHVRFSRRKLPADLVTIRAGLPVTTIPRTIVDLIRDDTDLSLVADVLRDANASMEVDYPKLTTLLGSVAQRVGLPRGDGQAVLDKLQSISDFIITPTPVTVAQREALRDFATHVAMPDVGKTIESPALNRLRDAITSATSRQVLESLRPILQQGNETGADLAKMLEKSGIGEALANAASRQILRDIQPLLVQPEMADALARALAPHHAQMRHLAGAIETSHQSMPPKPAERGDDDRERSDLQDSRGTRAGVQGSGQAHRSRGRDQLERG